MTNDPLRDALRTASKTNPRADNTFGVGITGAGMLTLLRPPAPFQAMDKATALELAAWIVTLANDDEGWAAALRAVQR